MRRNMLLSLKNRIGAKLFDWARKSLYNRATLRAYLAENESNLWIATKAIRDFENGKRFFSNAPLPDRIDGFEDLVFLFHSDSQANFGIILLSLENASYLFKLVRSLDSPRIVEIGRYRGGSTFLMACASDEGARIISIDLFVSNSEWDEGHDLDKELMDALSKYELNHKVELVVGDSSTFRMGEESVDLVFVDGDHSYDGVKGDFENWYPALRTGGHILFDDSCPTRFGSCATGVFELLEEIDRDNTIRLKKIAIKGSLTHYQKV
jgi:predicted O-methyltransferase YrrM